MEPGKPFCTAPLTWQDGLTRYPPSQSYEWNSITLQPADYDQEFYGLIIELDEKDRESGFAEADVNNFRLNFSLVTANGAKYNLIPNGSEIRVTKSNLREYFQRVHYAYDLLRRGVALTAPPPPPATVPALPRIRSAATGLRLTAPNLPAINWLRWCANEDPERLIISPGDKLRWAVVPRGNDFLLRLRTDGEHVIVSPDDLPAFLTELLLLADDICRAIANFGYYPPNSVCAAPAEGLAEPVAVTTTATPSHPTGTVSPKAAAPLVPSPRPAGAPMPPRRLSSNGRTALYASARAAAAAAAAATGQDRRYIPSASPEELEKQRALFSPTHDTGNILSPFQEINL